MISFNQFALRRGSKLLVEDLNWTIYPKQKVGLIGANGSGKTSLFSVLLGQVEPDKGELNIAKNLQIASVQQEAQASAQSAIEFVISGDDELCRLQQRLDQAEASHDGMQIAKLHERLHHIDGYSAHARAGQLLNGLGFVHSKHELPVSGFSGGWRMRLNLAKALMCRSDVLLLDEPTNHLDLDAILWLESWLQRYQGTLLIVSHDRDFLDRAVNVIAHLEHQKIKTYTGNYSQFETQRALDLQLQQAAFEKQQKQITHMRSYVDRFRYKASKARQAQSRLKAIERIQLVSAVDQGASFSFEFKAVGRCPDPLINFTLADIGYDDRTIIHKLNLAVRPGDRLAVLGPNGAGKSTLIKAIFGGLEPQSGVRTVSPKTKFGYFAQHQVDTLHLDASPLQHLRDLDRMTDELSVRKFLGSFAFSGERIDQQVGLFSGGEKARLALALIVWQQPNVLLLDEPTNHLDLDMRQALSIALQSFEGAMIVVSHDRFLLNTNSDALYLLADGKLDLFDGDLDDYETWLLNYRKQVDAGVGQQADASNKKSDRQQRAKDREKLRPLTKKLKSVENDLEKLQKKLNSIETELADPELYQDSQKLKLQEVLQLQAKLVHDQERIENEWMQISEELNSIDNE